MPVDDNVEDHSYEYAATQVIAEYLRSKHYDGKIGKVIKTRAVSWKDNENNRKWNRI